MGVEEGRGAWMTGCFGAREGRDDKKRRDIHTVITSRFLSTPKPISIPPALVTALVKWWSCILWVVTLPVFFINCLIILIKE